MQSLKILASFLVTVVSTGALTAQEWTRFRGPNGTGHGELDNAPVSWADDDHAWKIRLPGEGHASPVLWGERIFIGSAVPERRMFVMAAYNAVDGGELWKREFSVGGYTMHRFNSLASATAAVDAEHVVFTRQDGEHCFLTALDHDGKTLWERDLGPFSSQHGSSHSPVIIDDKVILNYDQVLPGKVLALDIENGETVWEVPRAPRRADYSVPCLMEREGGSPVLLLNSSEDGITAVDPADGSIVWKTEPLLLRLRSVSSPIVAGGLTFASCGSGGGGNYIIAVRPPGSGNARAELAYEIRRSANYVPTPIAVGNRVYLWSDGGIVTCIDPVTGDEIWRERAGGNYFASPVAVGDKIYGTSTTGEVTVLRAGDTFNVLGTSDLGEATHATPAVANNHLYFRTLTHLIAVRGK